MLWLLPLATSASPDPVQWLINYGIAGVVLSLLILGRLRSKQEVDGLQRLADQRLEELRERDRAMTALVQQITTHTVPQLADAARLVESIPQPRNTEMELLRRLEQLTASITNVETEVLTRMETLAASVDKNSRRIERIEGGEK